MCSRVEAPISPDLPAEAPVTPVAKRKASRWRPLQIFGASVAIVLFAVFYALAIAANSKAARIPLSFQLAKFQLQRQLPRRIDDTTVLTGVRADGHTFVYEYEVENSQSPSGLKMSITGNVCDQQGMRSTMEAGGHYQYEFYDKTGHLLSSVFITARDCLI
jgi:hypothetical protein